MVDHYDRPRNVGSFDKTDASVGTGLVGAPACGDVMKLQIKVRLLPSACARQFVQPGGVVWRLLTVQQSACRDVPLLRTQVPWP